MHQMVSFKVLNLVTVFYFICSLGFSVWLGFDLYYTINPKNKVDNVDIKGRVEPKPSDGLNSNPKGIQISNHLFAELKIVTEKTPEIHKTVKPEHLEEIKKLEAQFDVVEDKHENHGIFTELEKEPVKTKISRKKLDEIVKSRQILLENDKDKNDGIFTELYYGLSNKNKISKKPDEMDKTKQKGLDKDKNDGIFTELYYGLSNKIKPEKKKTVSPEKHIQKVVEPKILGPEPGKMTDQVPKDVKGQHPEPLEKNVKETKRTDKSKRLEGGDGFDGVTNEFFD